MDLILLTHDIYSWGRRTSVGIGVWVNHPHSFDRGEFHPYRHKR